MADRAKCGRLPRIIRTAWKCFRRYPCTHQLNQRYKSDRWGINEGAGAARARWNLRLRLSLWMNSQQDIGDCGRAKRGLWNEAVAVQGIGRDPTGHQNHRHARSRMCRAAGEIQPGHVGLRIKGLKAPWNVPWLASP